MTFQFSVIIVEPSLTTEQNENILSAIFIEKNICIVVNNTWKPALRCDDQKNIEKPNLPQDMPTCTQVDFSRLPVYQMASLNCMIAITMAPVDYQQYTDPTATK